MLLENLTSKTCVVTANRRLAAYLSRRHDQLQAWSGKMSWISAEILPMDDWLKALWFNHTRDTRHLLTAYQERVLWNQIVQEKAASFHFIQRDQITRQVQKAWQFLNQWNLSKEVLSAYPFDETHQFFIQVADTFERICQDRGVIAFSRLIPALMEQDAQQHIPYPDQIVCVGFDDLYPQLSQFLGRVQQRTTVHQSAFLEPARKGRCVKLPLSWQSQEIEQAAQWAKTQWEINPKAEIGCVFLNLADIQEKVRTQFHAVFQHEKAAFNLSLGRALSEYPVMQAAITTLSLYVDSFIELPLLRDWLYSPFLIAAQTEMYPRLELSARLLAQGANGIDRHMLCAWLSRSGHKTCSPQLASALMQGERQFKALRSHLLPDQWAAWFIKMLSLLGWPGERVYNQEEYQVVLQFQETLDVFRQLNHFYGEMSLSEAFTLLKQLLDMTLFQPGTDQISPIQVMGFLEASGRVFDQLWVGGVSDEIWPGKLAPNPFLPASLQRRMGMPHACPDRELLLGRRITERFFQSADEVIFSYAPVVKDTCPSASPLIASVKTSSLAEQLPNLLQKIEIQPAALEMLSVALAAPPVQAGETIRGGTAILKNQAACPFKAFAQNRLGVFRSQMLPWGLSALDKGNMIHQALESFWKTVKNQAHLLRLDVEVLRSMLQHLLEEIFRLLIGERPWLANALLIEVEKERMTALLLQWLEQEKLRDDFEVAAVEQTFIIPFEQMRISVKLDRMDRQKDGRYILLDYKTGKVSLKSWEGERPDDPQLPFYWVMNDQSISAIAFAQIHAEGVEFKGLSEYSEILPNVQPPTEVKWGALKASWKANLETLLHNFHKGQAQVDPKKGKETCAACGLQMLCRVYEYRV